MKYSNTIEVLDKIDCEIFFGKFKMSRVISIILAFFLGLIVVFTTEEDLQLYYGLFIVTILSSLIYAYGYYRFNKIITNDKKIVQKFEIIDKSKVFVLYDFRTEYSIYFQNGNRRLEKRINRNIYKRFKIGDKIAFHYLEGQAFYFRYKRVY